MKLVPALIATVGLVLALVEGWYQVMVVLFVLYVIWIFIRTPLAKRARENREGWRR